MTRRDTLLVALVAALWGLNFLVIDVGMGDVPPLVFLAVRFLVVIFPAVLVVPRPQATWRSLAAVGLLMSAGQFGFLYAAIAAGLPPGIAALVLQAQVVFTVLIAAGVLRERPTRRQAAGVVVGVLGLVVVALGRGGDVELVALMLCLAGACSWGAGNVVARALRIPGGLGLVVWSGLFVPVPVLGLALVLDGPSAVVAGLGAFDTSAVLATLYTAGAASLLGYGIFNSLLARHDAATLVPWILLVPVVAIVASWLALGDLPTPGEATGGVLLVVGVAVANLGGRRRRTAAPAPEPDPGSADRVALRTQ